MVTELPSAIMAEFAAHLNQGLSDNRPTIFEVVAEESMANVLKPAVSYALKVLATSNPDRWSWLWRFGDELHVFLDYIVQNYYLKNFNGSISENFYSLKRVRINGVEIKEGSLSTSERYLSLLMLVGVPYGKLKLDQLFERVREENVSGMLSSYSSRKRSYLLHLKRIFIYVYPFVHFTWETIFLCYYFLYIFKFSQAHSPLLHVIGLSLQRLARQDILRHSSVKNVSQRLASGKTVAERVAAITGSVSSILGTVLTSGLPVVIFFLKFMDWWYSSDHDGATRSVTQLPIPPPPPQPKVRKYKLSTGLYYNDLNRFF